jgi:hypothetical protein
MPAIAIRFLSLIGNVTRRNTRDRPALPSIRDLNGASRGRLQGDTDQPHGGDSLLAKTPVSYRAVRYASRSSSTSSSASSHSEAGWSDVPC